MSRFSRAASPVPVRPRSALTTGIALLVITMWVFCSPALAAPGDPAFYNEGVDYLKARGGTCVFLPAGPETVPWDREECVLNDAPAGAENSNCNMNRYSTGPAGGCIIYSPNRQRRCERREDTRYPGPTPDPENSNRADTYGHWNGAATLAECLGDQPAPQCADRVDNDNDGDIDYPRDSGCATPEDPTERQNRAPCAAPDRYYVARGRTLRIPMRTGLLANDTDPDADALKIVVKQLSFARTKLKLQSNGSFSFRATAQKPSIAKIDYLVRDPSKAESDVVETRIYIGQKPPSLAPWACVGGERELQGKEEIVVKRDTLRLDNKTGIAARHAKNMAQNFAGWIKARALECGVAHIVNRVKSKLGRGNIVAVLDRIRVWQGLPGGCDAVKQYAKAAAAYLAWYLAYKDRKTARLETTTNIVWINKHGFDRCEWRVYFPYPVKVMTLKTTKPGDECFGERAAN